MKKYIGYFDNGSSIEECEYFVAHKSDIKAMYKSIRRSRVTHLCPLFCDFPQFSEYKEVYVLCIEDGYFFTVMNCDNFMRLMLNPEMHIQELL